MKTTLRILTLTLLATASLNSSAQILPPYEEPYENVQRYVNINSELVNRYNSNDITLTDEEVKLARCSKRADTAGMYMVTHQNQSVPLNMWLEEVGRRHGNLLEITYDMPIGKTTSEKVWLLETFTKLIFKNCMEK